MPLKHQMRHKTHIRHSQPQNMSPLFPKKTFHGENSAKMYHFRNFDGLLMVCVIKHQKSK